MSAEEQLADNLTTFDHFVPSPLLRMQLWNRRLPCCTAASRSAAPAPAPSRSPCSVRYFCAEAKPFSQAASSRWFQDAQFFQLGGLFSCHQAARALPGLYLPLELEPLCPQARRCGWYSLGQLQGALFGAGIGGSLTDTAPPSGFLHLPAQLAIQAVGPLHGALPAGSPAFCCFGLGHGLGAVLPQGTAVAQPSNCAIRSNTGTLRLPAATSARQSICLKVDIRLDWRTRMTPASPLQRLLDSRRVDAEQDLGPGGCIDRRGRSPRRQNPQSRRDPA